MFGGHPVETAKTAAAHDYLRARATAEDAGSKCLPETEIAVLPDQPPTSLRRHELRSPITGRVAERRVDLGALVGREGQESELYVIADLSEVWADLAVSPAELSNIQEGQVITLFAGASGERAKAKVIFVSPLLDKDTRTARVVALLPNPTHQWRPGSFATAEFHSRRSPPASSSPSSPSSGATPVRVKDVADVAIGRELRTGSASVNGHEAVLGTALMLVGGNSWTVAAAADAKIKEINKSLPPGIQARTLLNRTRLVDATIKVTCLKPAPSIKLFWLSH